MPNTPEIHKMAQILFLGEFLLRFGDKPLQKTQGYLKKFLVKTSTLLLLHFQFGKFESWERDKNGGLRCLAVP